ncbi:13885_t:CDS:2 [Funneliformis caledonium]|uniref:13885_t:CDS:1 n=2 Tax=Funneliformis TaxID=1117308 RepID=A0A9N9DDG3_9GLOM|nr:13885_t:CDS:2 [Funneliformis caledonium]CAG8693507.1 10378_t:CDS:2 [Funneliformis mosseae]
MENVQIAKRLSLLEEQKNLLIETAKTQGWIDDNSSTLEYDDREDFESEKLSVVNMVNAEETILEQQSLSTMEFRVHHLEKSIFGFDPVAKKALAYEKLKEQYSLLKRVDELKKEFNTIIMERDGADGLKTFLEIYDQVSELISPFKDSALVMERVILTPEAKAEIVASSANELELVAENLKQINELQSIIEAPEFKSFEKLLPQLTPIETIHIDQSSKANEVSARITNLLDTYNGIVNTLSEIFISWDHILTAIDANISLLERAKG